MDCGPTGIGVLYGRQETLETMPPFHGGGEMILTVEYQKSTWKPAPHRFEAGTPNISGAVGLHAAMDYLDKIGRDNIAAHDQELGAYAFAKLSGIDGIRLFGPHVGRAGLVSFLLNDVHAHDVVMLANQRGVALRGGHHCTQPLMHKLGVESTARASFYFYNTTQEIDRLVEVLREIQKFFASLHCGTAAMGVTASRGFELRFGRFRTICFGKLAFRFKVSSRPPGNSHGPGTRGGGCPGS